MSYPRVLIVALGRINAADTANNSLLLKNLFWGWPKKNLAQIYSGGSNNDNGFCAHEYQLCPDDRRFGRLFFNLKNEYGDCSSTSSLFKLEHSSRQKSSIRILGKHVGKYLVDSGLYELLFKLKPSKQLREWVRSFDPEIILAQGYNLSFVWLPLILKQKQRKPLAFYCSDDWPSYLYSSRKGLCAITAPLLRWIVTRSTKKLLSETDVPFAFNDLMGEEYARRYGKPFTTIMHCDDPERFSRADPIRLCPPETKSIIAAGAFDDSRWPLLLDLEEVCCRLNNGGMSVRATILASRISEEGYRRMKSCKFIEIMNDPGHDLLPSFLKGADLLYLSETFDEKIAQGFRYSISTKAHLFMFSQKPILVYGHQECGLVRYAKNDRWGSVVDVRSLNVLEKSLYDLLSDGELRKKNVSSALNIAMRHNDCVNVREVFRVKMVNSIKLG